MCRSAWIGNGNGKVGIRIKGKDDNGKEGDYCGKRHTANSSRGRCLFKLRKVTASLRFRLESSTTCFSGVIGKGPSLL